MNTQELSIRATRDEVKEIVNGFIRTLAGRSSDHLTLARGLQLRIGMVMLSQINEDFVTKSRGGTGVDGIKWKPLSPITIMNRRFGPGEKGRLNKAAGVRDRGGLRPLLTAELDKEWRKIFVRTKAMLEARGLSEGEAKRRAAATAWIKVKEMGGKTKKMVYGGREVDILVDMGELRRSFTPGVDGNIHKAEPGLVIVGTNKKPWHHGGTRRGLPSRPYWPLDGNFPMDYWTPILRETQRGILEAFVSILGGSA